MWYWIGSGGDPVSARRAFAQSTPKTNRLRPAAMANLLGDLWEYGEPNWAAACLIPGVHLHLYGKAAPRPGRKMGHLTALGHTPDEALRLALRARAAL